MKGQSWPRGKSFVFVSVYFSSTHSILIDTNFFLLRSSQICLSQYLIEDLPCLYLNPQASPPHLLPCPVEEGLEGAAEGSQPRSDHHTHTSLFCSTVTCLEMFALNSVSR